MTDARFSSDAGWKEQHAELRRRGEALFAELGEPGPLLSGVAGILRGESDAAAELPAELAAEVEGFVAQREVRSLGAFVAIARCLAAEALAGEPSAERVQAAAERFKRSPHWVHDAFEEEILALLAPRELAVREAWLTAWEAAPPLPAPAAGPQAAVEVFRPPGRWKIDDPLELWIDREAGAGILLVAAYAPGTLLRKADPDRWFRAVDRWDDPRLIEGALFGAHVSHDADALLHWLAIASPVFDTAGGWSGRTAAAILTQRVLDHAKALVTASLPRPDAAGEEEAVADLRDRELPALFEKAWNVLLARPDGIALATALYTRLSAPDTWPRVWRVGYLVIARTILERALVSARLSVKLLRSLHAKRQPPGNQSARGAHGSALTALGAAVALSSDEPANNVELFEWFEELLTSPAADWDAFVHQNALDGLLADLSPRVASVEGIVERCDAAYRSLEFGRRCGEFRRGRGLNEAQRASVVLLGLLLHVLGRSGGDVSLKRDALARTFGRALRLALVSSIFRAVGRVRPRALVTFAVALSAQLDPKSLAARLAPLRSHPGHTAECVTVLLEASPEDVLARTLGVASLDDFVASVDAWAEATGHPEDLAAKAALVAALKKKRADVRDGAEPAQSAAPGAGA